MTNQTAHDIQQAVLQELKWDMRVTETEVGVEVDKAIVTLSGTVSSYAKKLAAQEAAHRVNGVLDVANEVEVQIPNHMGKTDTEIAQAIRNALQWDVLVPADNINSTVANGWVTLNGEVNFWYEREDAEQAIRHLLGVRGVSNQLMITPTKYPQAPELKSLIEKALERRADSEAQKVEVTVHGGTITLSGGVPSWKDKQEIISEVSHAPGVQNIRDYLFVIPG
jgi:osmotically-inducible protein OsmY